MFYLVATIGLFICVAGALVIPNNKPKGLEMVAIGNLVMIIGFILWKILGG
jgi:hypothetical protein